MDRIIYLPFKFAVSSLSVVVRVMQFKLLQFTFSTLVPFNYVYKPEEVY